MKLDWTFLKGRDLELKASVPTSSEVHSLDVGRYEIDIDRRYKVDVDRYEIDVDRCRSWNGLTTR